MATTPKEQQATGQVAVKANDATKAAEEAKPVVAAAIEVPERQPGDDMDPEDLAQFDG
ncbi:MAG: hypothetical protein M9925_09095 [Chloroflexi bacterium]|nr:hypothetical protein [Dehalococcoidia bacterium]MCO5201838.1 hypothetical protein [Chloroflexota bacterium]MCZ7577178.1 hypothetical protein [Dehalococcoidia bacterium]